jgi:hypothetical protein
MLKYVYCLRINAPSNVKEIKQCTSIFEGSMVFIEFEEQLIDSLYIRESVVDEDMASGARIFWVHDRLSRGHDSLWVTSLVRLQVHDLDLLRAQRPLDLG